MYFSEERRHWWIPAPSARGLATLAWWSVPGLPIVILAVRMISANAGMVTAFAAIPVGFVLAVLGILPAAAALMLADRVRPTRSLWWSYAGLAVWQLCCFVGLGLNISNMTDAEDFSAPLDWLIPDDLEMVVAGWLVAIGFAGLVFSAASVEWIMHRQEEERK